MSDTTKPYTLRNTLKGLRYIANSPPQEYGGFHPETVQIAKSALHQIKKLESENASLVYWSETHHRWASAHCAERMADFERHRKELARVLKLRKRNSIRHSLSAKV